jgi:hypothetical protein
MGKYGRRKSSYTLGLSEREKGAVEEALRCYDRVCERAIRRAEKTPARSFSHSHNPLDRVVSVVQWERDRRTVRRVLRKLGISAEEYE